MEIASSSRALHLFPTNRKEEDRCDVMRKKRKVCSVFPNETTLRSKITKPVDVTVAKPEKSVTALRLTKTNPKVTKSVPERSITLSRIRLHQETNMKPKVITKPIDEEIEDNRSCSLRDLIAKAKKKVEEKKQIDGRRDYIARLRLEARLAINQVVRTVVVADDHLKYHYELEQLGCGFIHDEVTYLTKFSFLSRSDYSDESTYSVLEETEP